jgi:hypothetical protein
MAVTSLIYMAHVPKLPYSQKHYRCFVMQASMAHRSNASRISVRSHRSGLMVFDEAALRRTVGGWLARPGLMVLDD